MKEKKWIKMKIGVRSAVKAKVGEMEENTRERRSIRMRKEVVACVQAVVGKNRLLFQFKDGQKKEMSSCLLLFLSSKEEAETDEPLSNSPKKEQGKLLIIDGNPEIGEPCMFVRGMYLSVFYFLCYVKEISTDLLEE